MQKLPLIFQPTLLRRNRNSALFLIGFVFLGFVSACQNDKEKTVVTAAVADSVHSIPCVRGRLSAFEKELKEAGLIDVQSLDSSIRVDLKYSSVNNFLGIDVYGDMTAAYLQPDVAQQLVQAQKELHRLHPGYSLMVYDAARPVKLQQIFWDSIKVSRAERSRYVSNPARGGSIHNYGAAVDVGIVDSTSKELDMGCPFDFFGVLSYPSAEARLLSEGKLTEEQVRHRKLLRTVMYKAGFYNIQTEWWHFNACTREAARKKYTILQ
jgi:D-alanyl-D-alanine dipeptidase